MLLIFIAWIPETIQNFRERGKSLNYRFVLLYLAGSLMLAYHALELHDMVFLLMNALASLIAVANMLIILAGGKRGRKK